MHRWGIVKSAVCECRQQQTVNDIVDMCPVTVFEGRLQSVHNVDCDALNWLETTAGTMLAE